MLYSADRPEVHAVIAELRSVSDEYEDRVLIGEIYLPVERLVAYYGTELKGARRRHVTPDVTWHAYCVLR
jgi:alpha-glucosidase